MLSRHSIRGQRQRPRRRQRRQALCRQRPPALRHRRPHLRRSGRIHRSCCPDGSRTNAENPCTRRDIERSGCSFTYPGFLLVAVKEPAQALFEREDLLLAKELAECSGGIPCRPHSETISPTTIQVKGQSSQTRSLLQREGTVPIIAR